MHIHIIRMLYSVWRLYLLYNTLGVLSHTLSHKSLYILKIETELSTISNHDIAKLICSETINLSNGIKKKFLNSSWVKQEIQSYIIKHLKGTTNKNTTGQNLPVIYIFFPTWISTELNKATECYPYNHYHNR